MQRSTDLLKKLRQKIILEQPIWKELQKFKANHFWSLPLKHSSRSIVRKAVQLFKSLDHAMIFWTACYDNECSIHWSKKENQLWYPSISSRPPASLPLLVSKLEEKSSTDTIFISKTIPSKINPIENTYRLNNLQIQE